MNFTDEQYRALAPYEQHFRTAVNARWTRNPGREALTLMQGIYDSVTGRPSRLNYGCGTCILHLVQDCGRLWLADKAARETAGAKRKVGMDKTSTGRKKVPVKADNEKKKEVSMEGIWY